jgi:hypothetical protein
MGVCARKEAKESKEYEEGRKHRVRNNTIGANSERIHFIRLNPIEI